MLIRKRRVYFEGLELGQELEDLGHGLGGVPAALAPVGVEDLELPEAAAPERRGHGVQGEE